MTTRAGLPRLLTLAGAVEPVWLLGTAAIFGAFRAGYDATHAISELGEQGAPNAVAWNVAGFGVAALLLAVFAFAIRDSLGAGWLFRVVLLQALFLGASATFGCDPGCPPTMSSWQGWAHVVVGLVYFALACVSPLVGWRAIRAHPQLRSLAPVSVAAGLALVALFFAGPVVFGPGLVGVWQRITLGTAGAWTTLVALHLWSVRSLPGPVKDGTAT